MRHDTRQFLEILRAYDDPVHIEMPPGFDNVSAEERFLTFARALQRTLSIPADRVETGPMIQDAAHHGAVTFRDRRLFGPATADGHITVFVSNWGGMVVVYNEKALSAGSLRQIIQVIDQHGYIYIPICVINLPYDGKNSYFNGRS